MRHPALNRQIIGLAPVLNSDAGGGRRTEDRGQRSEVGGQRSEVVQSDNPSVPVAAMVRKWNGATYIFAVAMRDGSATATFAVPGPGDGAKAEVLDESRSVPVSKGSFKDHFGPWMSTSPPVTIAG